MRRLVFVSVALGLLATSCGISTEERPRPIAERQQVVLDGAAAASSAGATVGSARIYLLSPKIDGVGRTLEPVARNVEQPADVLASLLSGPNEQELGLQLRTAIPADTQLRSVRFDRSVLTIDLSAELEDLAGEALVQAIAQLVFTADAIAGVSAVRISIEGRLRQWPGPTGELQDLLLTSYSFPGLLLTSQPAYPPKSLQP
jgi:spore germination protein GerM